MHTIHISSKSNLPILALWSVAMRHSVLFAGKLSIYKVSVVVVDFSLGLSRACLRALDHLERDQIGFSLDKSDLVLFSYRRHSRRACARVRRARRPPLGADGLAPTANADTLAG